MSVDSCILWSAIFLNLTQNFLKLSHITLRKRKNQFICFLLKFILSVFKRTIQFLIIVLEKIWITYIFSKGGGKDLSYYRYGLGMKLFRNMQNALGSSQLLSHSPISRYIKNLVWKNAHYFSKVFWRFCKYILKTARAQWIFLPCKETCQVGEIWFRQ